MMATQSEWTVDRWADAKLGCAVGTVHIRVTSEEPLSSGPNPLLAWTRASWGSAAAAAEGQADEPMHSK